MSKLYEFKVGDICRFEGDTFTIKEIFLNSHLDGTEGWEENDWCTPVEDNTNHHAYCLEDIEKVPITPTGHHSIQIDVNSMCRVKELGDQFELRATPELEQAIMTINEACSKRVDRELRFYTKERIINVY